MRRENDVAAWENKISYVYTSIGSIKAISHLSDANNCVGWWVSHFMRYMLQILLLVGCRYLVLVYIVIFSLIYAVGGCGIL